MDKPHHQAAQTASIKLKTDRRRAEKLARKSRSATATLPLNSNKKRPAEAPLLPEKPKKKFKVVRASVSLATTSAQAALTSAQLAPQAELARVQADFDKIKSNGDRVKERTELAIQLASLIAEREGLGEKEALELLFSICRRGFTTNNAPKMLRQPVQRYASLVEPEDPYARFILEWTTMKSMTRINIAGGMNHLFRRVFGKEAPADFQSLSKIEILAMVLRHYSKPTGACVPPVAFLPGCLALDPRVVLAVFKEEHFYDIFMKQLEHFTTLDAETLAATSKHSVRTTSAIVSKSTRSSDMIAFAHHYTGFMSSPDWFKIRHSSSGQMQIEKVGVGALKDTLAVQTQNFQDPICTYNLNHVDERIVESAAREGGSLQKALTFSPTSRYQSTLGLHQDKETIKSTLFSFCRLSGRLAHLLGWKTYKQAIIYRYFDSLSSAGMGGNDNELDSDINPKYDELYNLLSQMKLSDEQHARMHVKVSKCFEDSFGEEHLFLGLRYICQNADRLVKTMPKSQLDRYVSSQAEPQTSFKEEEDNDEDSAIAAPTTEQIKSVKSFLADTCKVGQSGSRGNVESRSKPNAATLKQVESIEGHFRRPKSGHEVGKAEDENMQCKKDAWTSTRYSGMMDVPAAGANENIRNDTSPGKQVLKQKRMRQLRPLQASDSIEEIAIEDIPLPEAGLPEDERISRPRARMSPRKGTTSSATQPSGGVILLSSDSEEDQQDSR